MADLKQTLRVVRTDDPSSAFGVDCSRGANFVGEVRDGNGCGVAFPVAGHRSSEGLEEREEFSCRLVHALSLQLFGVFEEGLLLVLA